MAAHQVDPKTSGSKLTTSTGASPVPTPPIQELRNAPLPPTTLPYADIISATPTNRTLTFSSDMSGDRDNLTPTTTPLKQSEFKSPADVHPLEEVQTARPSIWIWRVEIFMCFLSLASFAVIIAVLRVYDGTKLISLPLNITLNAFLSFFTTLAKAAFMIPVAEAMSQWKWNMYGTNRAGWPMNDFNMIEQASRGTLGSLRLLLRYRWGHITVLGALVSIMGIATSPVTQQMIAYPVLPSPSSDSEGTLVRAPVARSLMPSAIGDDNISHLSPLWAALLATSGSSVTYPVADFQPPCPTGNCTFATYNSLAVCTKVEDITDQLTVTRIENSSSTQWTDNFSGWMDHMAPNGTTAYNASLPNGLSFITPFAYGFMQQLGNSYTTLAFKDQPDLANFTALIHVYLIYSNAGNVSYPGYDRTDETDWPFRAVEILYHMCVNTYLTTINSGNTSTAVIASSYSPLPVENNLPLVAPVCQFEDGAFRTTRCSLDYYNRIPGYTYLADPDDENKNFTIDRTAATLVAMDLAQIMSFQNEMYDGGAGSTTSTDGCFADSIFEAIYGYWYNVTDPDEQRARISANANNTAISVTNLLRAAEGSSFVEGTAWTLEPFVHVRWGFTAFFAVQLLFSCLFLALTIYLTRRGDLPVVKSDALAAILASNEQIARRVGTIGDMQGAERAAKQEKITLDRGTGRFQLV